jgi:hypothetical protein
MGGPGAAADPQLARGHSNHPDDDFWWDGERHSNDRHDRLPGNVRCWGLSRPDYYARRSPAFDPTTDIGRTGVTIFATHLSRIAAADQ